MWPQLYVVEAINVGGKCPRKVDHAGDNSKDLDHAGGMLLAKGQRFYFF
jgi:hypothetical protein